MQDASQGVTCNALCALLGRRTADRGAGPWLVSASALVASKLRVRDFEACFWLSNYHFKSFLAPWHQVQGLRRAAERCPNSCFPSTVQQRLPLKQMGGGMATNELRLQGWTPQGPHGSEVSCPAGFLSGHAAQSMEAGTHLCSTDCCGMAELCP